MPCKCKKLYIYINKVSEKMHKLENTFYTAANIHLFYGQARLNFKNKHTLRSSWRSLGSLSFKSTSIPLVTSLVFTFSLVMVSLTSDGLLPESDAMADVFPYSSQDAKKKSSILFKYWYKESPNTNNGVENFSRPCSYLLWLPPQCVRNVPTQ